MTMLFEHCHPLNNEVKHYLVIISISKRRKKGADVFGNLLSLLHGKEEALEKSVDRSCDKLWLRNGYISCHNDIWGIH